MKEKNPLTPLKKLAAAAAQQAVEAITKLTGQKAIAATSSIRLISIEEALKEANHATHVSSIVVIKIQGDVKGLLFFSIDPSDAQVVVQDTLKHLAADTYTGQEQTVLCEIANVIAGTMINFTTKLLNLRLQQSPPSNTTDMPAAALDPFLAEFGTKFTKVLVQHDVFTLPDQSAKVKLLAVIDPPSTDLILQKIQGINVKNATNN